jgi:hypothetical protein
MSGILLGALAYSGLNKNKNIENKNDIKYSTNIKKSMDKIEYNQAKQNYRKPEYLNQFDDLRFDNIGEPAGENDTYNTLIGYNASLKRDLQAKNNFSFFDSGMDGTYNIVSDDKFVHNNMYPNTRQRDVDKSVNFSQRKMETFTGSSNNITLKNENKHLFEPVKNLSYVFGKPVYDDLLKQRYLASNKNNMGDLPFQAKAKVLPGIEGVVQQGPYAVYRINPPTIDQLRIDDNKKISYLNKPLETIKKGENRGTDFNLTKYKLPDFREQKFSDLVANKGVNNKEKQDGIYTNTNSQRGEDEYYQPGPSNNTNIGDGPNLNKTKFEKSKKELYLNDNTHSVTDNNYKPVFTNAKSYAVCDNQRATVNTNYQGGIQLATHIYTNKTDKAKQTIKQTTSHNIITNITPDVHESYTNITDKAKPTIKQSTMHNIVFNIVPNFNETYSNKTDTAKPTIKQCTSHNMVTNITPDIYESYSTIMDKLKPTIKQATSHNIITSISPDSYETYANKTDNAKSTIKQCTSHNIISNITPDIYEGYSNLTDNAKNTHRQTTETTYYIGGVNDTINHSSYVENEDNAKPTIKETTVIIPQPISNINISTSGIYSRTKDDIAKATIKQSTINNNYRSNIKADVNAQISHDAANNMTPNICREAVVTFNRPANGKADLHGPFIDKGNVKYADTILYSYAGNPHKGLDHGVTPTLSNKQIKDINIIKTNSKPINQTASYFINSNYINTLNNNPYVNDIYHQKNY